MPVCQIALPRNQSHPVCPESRGTGRMVPLRYKVERGSSYKGWGYSVILWTRAMTRKSETGEFRIAPLGGWPTEKSKYTNYSDPRR